MFIAYVPTSTHFFFFNDTATTEIYTLSLHDALPIYLEGEPGGGPELRDAVVAVEAPALRPPQALARSEEHTSELQSRSDLVCRLLLEKKKKKKPRHVQRVKIIR